MSYKKVSKSKIINAYDKIRELKLIESIPYTELIKFLILFTETEIAPLSNGNDPKIDLDYAKRFLRITVSFLYPRVAEKIRLLGDIYEELFLYLELLYEIEDVLCDRFIAALENFISSS